MLLAKITPVDVTSPNDVAPVTPNVPPTVALLSTCKPKPVDLLNVSVSAISATPLASKAPLNVVVPVTPNVPPTVALLSTCKPKPVALVNVSVSDVLRVPLI